MSSEISVRQAVDSDWEEISGIEQRWRRENVEPLSRETFDMWLSVHPQGFLVGEVDGSIISHSYFECIQFDPADVGVVSGWDRVFTRSYDEPMHDRKGNATLIMNAVTVPNTNGGLVVVNRIMELANEWGKEWFTTIPRMPELRDHYNQCVAHVGHELDPVTVAEWHCVLSMQEVQAPIWSGILGRVEGLSLPAPEKPASVVARFAGKKLGVTLVDVIKSGYPDPPSMNLAALCIKKLR
jgi:hypothetical protein